MKYFYQFADNTSANEIKKTKYKLEGYYGQGVYKLIHFIDNSSEEVPSLKNIPSSLFNYGYNNQKITIILDTTYQVSLNKDNDEKFVDNYCNLYQNNVYIDFYRFPFLNTSNIESLCKLFNSKVSMSSFRKVIEFQYNIFKKSMNQQKNQKKASYDFAMENGDKKEHYSNLESKRQEIMKYIVSNSADFKGKLTDLEILNKIEKNKNKKGAMYFGRTTYYRFKKKLESEKK